MSMIMSLVALSPKLTDAVRSRPGTTEELAYDPSEDESMAGFGVSIERTLPEAPGGRISLVQDWHPIQVILSGQPSSGDLPLGFLLAGEEIGEDAGYGPGCLLASEQVNEINKALADFDFLAAAHQVSAAKIAEADIYGWPSDPGGESVADLALPSFNAWREFVPGATQHERSIYVSIT